jgi:hypothetical protein
MLASRPARLAEKFDSILLTMDVRLDFPFLFHVCSFVCRVPLDSAGHIVIVC